MNKKYKIIIAVVVVAILAYAGYQLFFSNGLTQGSAVGSTNTSSRVNQIVCNQLATSTWASFLNTDSNDRVVVSTQLFFTEIGTATSSFSNIGVGTSTGVAGTSTTMLGYWSGIATTTYPVYLSANATNAQASSTYNFTTQAGRIWSSGSYLNFVANATSTGYCTIRVEYLPE